MSTVIQVENLSKYYRLGLIGGGTLREDLHRWWAKVRGQPDPLLKIGMEDHGNREDGELWALRDVSFDVCEGEILGIIGRNGAGKSTLLKILSRITAPTSGAVKIKGRVGSLLEVGTGFHPELTGRENIYLNGAILGMKKAEIDCKLDEIIDFAEIERFIDTPVKRYSSGMYVRLAFAVAAHLEPEILIVDEVLAVGDAAFQKKCLGKMGDVAKHGRTILFVSHNMGVIRDLVDWAIWIDKGQIVEDGASGNVVSHYLLSGLQGDSDIVELIDHPNRLKGMKKIIKRIGLKTIDGIFKRDFSQSDEVILEIEYGSDINLAGAGFILKTDDGICVGGYNTYMAFHPPHRIPSSGKICFIIPGKQLTPRSYLITVSIGSHQGALEDKIENCLSFTMHSSDIYKTGYLLKKEDGVASLFVKTEIY